LKYHVCVPASQCPRATPLAIECPAGKFSNATDLASLDGCQTCALGDACSAGTSVPQRCRAGRFGSASGQTSVECSGACLPGYFCDEGSTSNASGVCPAGRFNEYFGGKSWLDCQQCEVGRDSVNGSARCAICAKDYYRPRADSDAAECTLCSTIRGVVCPGRSADVQGTTTETLVLKSRFWRHSNVTLETHACKSAGSWSPCVGGADAGSDGDSYCAPGYRGPRCEICNGTTAQYFDRMDAGCHSCNEIMSRAQTSIVLGTMLLLMLVSAVLVAAGRSSRYGARLKGVVRLARYIRGGWKRAGMRYKVKALAGFWQCLAAVPSIFDMETPADLEHYKVWMNIIEFPVHLGLEVVVPGSCFGEYLNRLLLGALWPVAFVLLGFAMLVGWRLFRAHRNEELAFAVTASARAGLQEALPLTLVLTFIILPSTSSRIFRTFLCESYQYDAQGTIRRYLRADPMLRCDSDTYGSARTAAFGLVIMWPVGVPIFYFLLLWMSRDALRNRTPTPLSHATSFLSGDCNRSSSGGSHSKWPAS